ncbi:ATP-grasp domain-containing protein [Butyrivibrio sp. VCD2006]|uniref:ATP-grasp domain-containing protein n=1 Tax=Butyrivibrio sp. VCD2006 TaxID=1280664 RepID=UPI0004218021|nr:ATP-grasp domain-containing protein [Butyrivibrio sp. VCD2006]
MKKIFILGASALQVPAIKKAKEKGLYVYALDYDPEAVGIADADEFLCISTIDKEAVLEAAKKYEPDYIITSTSDMPVRTVAWVNEQLGRKNDISYENAICATDKAAMRRRMKEKGVPIPEFYVASDEIEFMYAMHQLGDRFVCKPADNAASRGVVLIDKKELIEKAGGEEGLDDELLKIYTYSKKYSRSGEVLLEEFMEGPEVSVESFTIEGKTHIITITDKMVTEIPFFVETGHTEPSRLPQDVREDIMRVAEAAINAVGIVNGPSHTEIKVTKNGAKLVEIAARLGGDFITSKLVPLSTGVDLIDCCLSSTLGEEVKWQTSKNAGSAIRFLFAKGEAESAGDSKDMIISSVEGAADAERMPGVTEVVIYKKPGDKATNLTNSGDRWGHVIAEGESAEDAAKKAEDAASRIRFILEQ